MRRATLAAAARCNLSELVSIIRKVFVNLIPHDYAKNEEENNVWSCSCNVSTRKTRTQGIDVNPESADYHETSSFRGRRPRDSTTTTLENHTGELATPLTRADITELVQQVVRTGVIAVDR